MRALGVDMGERRIGLAVSDRSGLIASPLEVISLEEGSDPIAEVLARAEELEVERIVVGMPINLRGEVGPAAEQMQGMVDELRRRASVPVETCDERLTTAAADRSMADAGLSSRDRRGQVDKVAAALILQSWLDSRRHRADTDA
ncbi:MAG: Holliday junction resolvase RuvX [Armatimonadota bacterium]|nr:Holliday junction resolvase RuvX [Armatimonadota bacterium]